MTTDSGSLMATLGRGADAPRSRPLPVLRSRVPRIVLFLFAGTILLPQGVGIRLPYNLPNLDLPRIAAILLAVRLVFVVLSSGKVRVFGAHALFVLLPLIASWQVLAAIFSESEASLLWAVSNLITMCLVPLAFVASAGGYYRREQIVRFLTLLVVILAAWSVIELVTQHRLVPVRNLWVGETQFSLHIRRVMPGLGVQLPYFSIGPYGVSLTLAGVLCLFGGFLLVQGEKSKWQHRGALLLLGVGVLGTQSRAALIALTAMVAVMVLQRPVSRERLTSALVCALALVGAVAVSGGLQTSLSLALSQATDASHGGSLGSRVSAIAVLFSSIDRWWFIGYGPGSIFNPERVVSSVPGGSDPGSFFGFFFESGLPVGLAITWLILSNIWRGLRAHDSNLRAAALGLFGFFVTTLSSLTPWGWGPALCMAGLMESWLRTERSAKREPVEAVHAGNL